MNLLCFRFVYGLLLMPMACWGTPKKILWNEYECYARARWARSCHCKCLHCLSELLVLIFEFNKSNISWLQEAYSLISQKIVMYSTSWMHFRSLSSMIGRYASVWYATRICWSLLVKMTFPTTCIMNDCITITTDGLNSMSWTKALISTSSHAVF